MIKLIPKKGRDHNDVWVFFVVYNILTDIPGMNDGVLKACSTERHTTFIPAVDADQARAMVRRAHGGKSVGFDKVEKVGGWNSKWAN